MTSREDPARSPHPVTSGDTQMKTTASRDQDGHLHEDRMEGKYLSAVFRKMLYDGASKWPDILLVKVKLYLSY